MRCEESKWPPLKSSFIDDVKPIRKKVHFLDFNGIIVTGRWTDKQMDNCTTICSKCFYFWGIQRKDKAKKWQVKNCVSS